MAALWNRAGHYIFALWFLSFYLSFFSRLISAAADWISIVYHTSTHDVALVRIYNMVWNVLQADRWKYRTQKWCKKSPSEHHRTTISSQL